MASGIKSILSLVFCSVISTGVWAKTESPTTEDEEKVELSKSMESEFGKIDLKIDEKPKPEPALKPYWLTLKVACKSGKKFSKRYDVCDSDLAMTVEDGVLKTSYFLGDPQSTDDDSQDEELICDEENPVNIEHDLKKICAAPVKAKTSPAKTQTPPAKSK